MSTTIYSMWLSCSRGITWDLSKELLKEIKKLKASKPLFDDLPTKLKPFFYEQAKEELKRDYGMTDENIRF